MRSLMALAEPNIATRKAIARLDYTWLVVCSLTSQSNYEYERYWREDCR